MSRERDTCACGERATAAAYGEPLCLTCYREAGWADPRLLGGLPEGAPRPRTPEDVLELRRQAGRAAP